ncbi:MAG: ankyrin repeat domain-containing protein [Gammaproteobacteria bacterium]|nr:ankyrin repeat domain-containing protein [Gammaproteobacteria bacterium]MBU1646612.1 ankyrin repeat domain-containing protein [Gammaproteobacteria bacterium]MBU1972869.1 ankyrin repeat domain-containing protein [Gammaproteobacteria bacterium]
MPKLLAVLFALALHSGAVRAGAYDDILAGAEHNRIEVVVSLLQLGLDANTATPDGTTLLMTASRNGNLEMVDMLLKNKANHLIRNKYGDTALMLATLNGRMDVVRRLVDLGGKQENRDGWSALHYAAFGGHTEIARYLMSRNASVDLRAPNSQTALMLAAANGRLDMVKFLIDEMADLRLKDREGKTAREIAKERGHQAIVDYLELF